MVKNKLLKQHATNVNTFEVLRFQPTPHKTQDDDNQKTKAQDNTETRKYEQHGRPPKTEGEHRSSTDPTKNQG